MSVGFFLFDLLTTTWYLSLNFFDKFVVGEGESRSHIPLQVASFTQPSGQYDINTVLVFVVAICLAFVLIFDIEK